VFRRRMRAKRGAATRLVESCRSQGPLKDVNKRSRLPEARALTRGVLLICTVAGCSAQAETPAVPTSGGGASSTPGAAGSQSASGAPSATNAGGTPNGGAAGMSGPSFGGSGAAGGAGTGTSAGAAGTFGGAAAGGATSDGSAGTTATGGASAACPGIPIVPDAMGFVAPSSNTLGIHGSWFEYSDCTDLKNVNCSTVTTPAANSFANVGGKMCTSGHTSTAAAAWGAGIGLELNDGPPQMPYDTTAHGITGFCFVLSGSTIPSTTIRVAFPTKDNNDNAYFSPVSALGQHTVLFSDTAQGSWVTTKAAFEPTKVMLLQFQIPASTTAAVPWDFCIEGLTAITQ
jgi:hypothetical protein